MSKEFHEVEYSRVQLDSPEKGGSSAHDDQDPTGITEDDEEELLASERITSEQKEQEPTFWRFEFYQQLFDVDTSQVARRLLGSMIPHPRVNFLRQTLQPKADLYGPFWVCTTLIFTTAIAGNLANYLQYHGSNAGKWHYDFKKVTLSAIAVYSYWWLVPLIVWGYLRWRSSATGTGTVRGQPVAKSHRFVDVLSAYGYSLAIYIPISFLWVIQFNWLQWSLVAVAMVMSGTVLLLSFWPAVSGDRKQFSLGLMVLILLLHSSLAVGFMMYFFHVPDASGKSASTTNSTNTSTAATTIFTNHSA